MNFYSLTKKLLIDFYLIFILLIICLNFVNGILLQLSTDEDLEDLCFQDIASANGIIMKWNITAIPAISSIENATLCLYVDTSLGDNDLAVWYINNESWIEADEFASLDTFVQLNQTSAILSSFTAGNWGCFNITTQMQQSYTNGNSNFTVWFEDPDDFVGGMVSTGDLGLYIGNVPTEGYFEDRENTGSSGNTPYLNINYASADSTPPTISIAYPTNTTYNYNVSEFNYTSDEGGHCWYSDDNGVTNSSTSAVGANFTDVETAEGSNNFTLYCNDTAGNDASASVVFWKDSSAPVINLSSPSSASSSYSTSTTFSFTVTDSSPANCSLILNNAVVAFNSSVNITGGTMSFTNTTIAGSYTWYVNCTDELTNTDNSSSRTFTILSSATHTGKASSSSSSTCTSSCVDKECGNDGCGGSCGTCNLGETCIVDVCVSCVEKWVCGEWGICEDNFQFRVCTDENACGTEVSKPDLKKDCFVEANWSCGDWGECNAGHTVKDVLEENVLINSYKSRTCIDMNGNYPERIEKQRCDLIVPVEVKKIDVEVGDAVEVVDSRTGDVVARIKKSSIAGYEQDRVDVVFII